MARGNQTFRKRQRENKLREKAQQKRERREQRKNEKKGSPVDLEDQSTPNESARLEEEPEAAVASRLAPGVTGS
jgi:hypothetical protein